jgi:8-oxo-dGTP pyrophosphatase MutT (NUDIX family)
VWQIAVLRNGWLNPNLCAQRDKTFLAAALRETQEEVGIVPEQVEILGQVGPPELSLGGLRVWPYVVRHPPFNRYNRLWQMPHVLLTHQLQCQGFIHATPQFRSQSRLHEADDDPEASLASLQMESLVLSRAEVAAAFHLPLAATVSPARLRLDYFRGEEPYWAIDVSDLVQSAPRTELSRLDGDEQGQCLQVWGLTGWYLFLFMKALEIYQ